MKSVKVGPKSERPLVIDEKDEIKKVAPELFSGHKITWYKLGQLVGFLSIIKALISEEYRNMIRDAFFEHLQKELIGEKMEKQISTDFLTSIMNLSDDDMVSAKKEALILQVEKKLLDKFEELIKGPDLFNYRISRLREEIESVGSESLGNAKQRLLDNLEKRLLDYYKTEVDKLVKGTDVSKCAQLRSEIYSKIGNTQVKQAFIDKINFFEIKIRYKEMMALQSEYKEVNTQEYEKKATAARERKNNYLNRMLKFCINKGSLDDFHDLVNLIEQDMDTNLIEQNMAVYGILSEAISKSRLNDSEKKMLSGKIEASKTKIKSKVGVTQDLKDNSYESLINSCSQKQSLAGLKDAVNKADIGVEKRSEFLLAVYEKFFEKFKLKLADLDINKQLASTRDFLQMIKEIPHSDRLMEQKNKLILAVEENLSLRDKLGTYETKVQNSVKSTGLHANGLVNLRLNINALPVASDDLITKKKALLDKIDIYVFFKRQIKREVPNTQEFKDLFYKSMVEFCYKKHATSLEGLEDTISLIDKDDMNDETRKKLLNDVKVKFQLKP